MTETTFLTLEWVTYLTVLTIAIYVSWRKGEKEGSKYMLKYLREGKYLDDTGFNKFMAHVRKEKRDNDKRDPRI